MLAGADGVGWRGGCLPACVFVYCGRECECQFDLCGIEERKPAAELWKQRGAKGREGLGERGTEGGKEAHTRLPSGTRGTYWADARRGRL